jgi:spermidine/putrescine transport system substrate-binding protein
MDGSMNQEMAPSRRGLLKAGLALGLGAPLLSSCGSANSVTAVSLKIATPDNPVRWPIYDTIPVIESGLSPEPGSTLRIYNYADYLSPKVIKAFEKEFSVEVELSTFNDTEEAIVKIASGSLDYDIYFPSYDQISKMVAAKLARPLNQDYLPNLKNCWSQFASPWYDLDARYSVPYATYTTGIGWRTDDVSEDIAGRDNPYDALWDESYRGRAAIIDDWHTAMGMVLLRNGIDDLNTDDTDEIQLIRNQLLDLADTSDPKVTITMYNTLPDGQLGICQMWSGDAVNSVYYLPKSRSADVLRYWFPTDGRGMIDNDLMMVLAGGKNPVAAHHFLNYLLDKEVAKTNFGFTGYQPPQKSINPTRLVEDGYIPENLRSATVLPEWFDAGSRVLGMPLMVEQQWLQVWQEFKAGA